MALSIDIESQSLKPNCVIMQVGVVAFDPYELNSAIKGSCNFALPVVPQQYLDFDVDPHTISWWQAKNPSLYAALLQEGQHPNDVNAIAFLKQKVIRLHLSITQLMQNASEEVWARGPQFDLVALKHLFAVFNMQTPWKYNAERDSRTIVAAAKQFADFKEPKWDTERFGVQHDALNDALAEAFLVQSAFHALTTIK